MNASTAEVARYPVYVWQIPVRVYHWVNALCVLTLIATAVPLALGRHSLRSREF